MTLLMKALIIGGGIIGLSSAYYLKQSGWDVTVLDRTDLSDNCSYGNLGMIVPSHFVPLAAPGILSQGIKWMFNSRSPFYVKPSLNIDLINWGLKFIKSTTQQNVDRAAIPLRDINLLSKQLYEQLQATAGFDFALEKKGILMYYKTEKFATHETYLAAKAQTLGLNVTVLNKEEVQALEPGTAIDIMGAAYYRCDAHLYPDNLMRQLLDHLKNSDVKFEINNAVSKLITENGKIKKVITAKEEYSGDLVLIAGGSWLPQLCRMAGVTVSLMPGKGYSFTINQPAEKLNIPAILCEARVAITPMNGHMRYGGTMEIAAVNNKVNMNRVEGIVRSVAEYFPGIQLEMPDKKDIWYGFRPCTPDGLPYLGYSKKVCNLIIAGGHAMSGLSQGPATGKIVAELANGLKTSININAFTPERFS
jgi:D-amino-acid dehydrogenase